MKDTKAALKWIVSILKSKNITFQIAGGFAARIYGSQRELADIDIDITDEDFKEIISEVKAYIIYGPDRYIDEHWDLKLMTLEYKGQVIDIAGEARIFDKGTGEWVKQKTDYDNNNPISIYGVTVPVIKKEALIAYKSKLLREVDRADIEALT